MGCPSTVVLGDNLTFSVCTHSPDTSAVTDADSEPTYRVYEDETATPVLTGTMAKLDDANTTGFYSEQIACTALNGFERGKSYTIYVTGAVSAVSGAISFGFTVDRGTYSVTGKQDANVTHINEAEVAGIGSSSDPWRAA